MRLNREDCGIKRGDLIEFTDENYFDYPPADTSVIRYGVAIEDEQGVNPRNGAPIVRVECADGSICLPRYIHASSWAGWIPEDLEPVAEKYAPFEPCDDDDDYPY